MPAPAKTSDAAIAAAARRLVEDDAPEFSMAAVAEAVGVRTPSLYKRYADREALLARVRCEAYDDMRSALVAAGAGLTGRALIRAMALAYRAFAIAHPRVYALLFSPGQRPDETTQAARVASVAPVFDALRPLVPAEHLLDAARTFTAFIHGHVSMETAGAFRLGGDVGAAFDYGLERIIDGIVVAPRARAMRPVRPKTAGANP